MDGLAALFVSVSMVAAVGVLALLRRRPRIAGFWRTMWSEWRPAVLVTLVYLGVAVAARPPGMTASTLPGFVLVTGPVMFLASLFGLGFAHLAPEFEPLAVRRGPRAWPKALAWTLMAAATPFILQPFAWLLEHAGVRGPAASGLDPMSFLRGRSYPDIFLILLVVAGIAEEVLWRLFTMTGLLALLRSRARALLVAGIIFGAYHLSPLDVLYRTFWQYPVYQFVTSAAAGILLGLAYLGGGLEAAILGHTLADFISVALSGVSK
ncbi:MAG: type II CAAX prenyl endopeptidase Rce1 family protein [Bacillota bacterium]